MSTRMCARGVRTFEHAEALAHSAWRFGWRFGIGDDAFDGHFPHQPILAGVFLVEMSQRAAEAALFSATSRQYRVVGVNRFRFLSPVLPGDACRLEVEWPADAPDGANLLVSVVFYKDAQRLAQGVLRVACPGASNAP